MTFPGTRQITMEVKWYLASFRASQDVRWAVEEARRSPPSLSTWRVQWGGMCALLKTSVHLMRIDAKRCFSASIREALAEAWKALGRDKSAFPLFWDFINRERNNILKEYAFSAYEGMLQEDGTIDVPKSLLTSLSEDRQLFIRGGQYDGRLALDVASEATEWVQSYLANAIRKGGFDPDERVTSDGFLYQRRKPLSEVL